VHGDVKASNVMLAGSGVSFRVVLMDFGIAAGQAVPNGDGRWARIAGTPAYMAPEQKRGVLVPASDVYGFGLLVCEAATGKRPSGSDPQAVIAAADAALRDIRLSKRSKALLRRCLAEHPANRFANGKDLYRALESVQRRPRRRMAAIATAVAIAAICGWVWLGRQGPRRHPAPTVAVLGFRNQTASSRAAYLSLMFSVALDADLGADGQVRVVPPAEVARSKTELDIHDSDRLSRETLQQVRSDLGADLVVFGSYDAPQDSGRIVLNVDVSDARSGARVGSVAATGRESDLPALLSTASARLRALLRLRATPLAAESVRTALPGSLEAMKLYSRGLEELRSFETIAAKDDLASAVEAAPDYPQAHSALSRAWAALGYDGRAREEAERAFQLRERLPEKDRLLIEAQYYETLRRPSEAGAYRHLLRLSPGNPDYMLALAAVQSSADALKTIAAIRRMGPLIASDPRVDLAEAKAANAADSYVLEQTCARRAAAGAMSRGALLLAAEARLYEGWSSRVLGKSGEAVSAYTSARDIFQRMGNLAGVARALRGLALVAQDQGDLARAGSLFQQSFATFRSIGFQEGAAEAVNDLAMVSSDQGRLDEAQGYYSQSLDICREVKSAVCIGTALNNLGYVLFRKGESREAQRDFHDAMQLFASVNGKYGESFVLSSMGDLLDAEGKLDEAERDLQRALDLSRALADRTSEASTESSLSLVLGHRGEFAAAIQMGQRAAAEQEHLGEAGADAHSDLVLSGIAIDQGRDRDAEAELNKALPELERSGRGDELAVARAMLSEALAREGERARSRAMAETAVKTLGSSQNRLARVQVLLATGVAAASYGDPKQAEQRLRLSAAQAQASGFALFAGRARRELSRLKISL
ncbi:MAG TPA: tetratricopeptide repeat protein, partial [Bryobacteraceae bacterium]|nr:tetratricopeptide repeat protein [Bryobacteraceae bacterium]